MEPLAAGVLGCGNISDAYLRGNDRFESYEVVACADIDVDRTREKAEEYGLEAYDPEGLLAEESIDLLINLTPPSAHAETCRDVLDAGKHVYVEKPMAASSADADAIVAAADREGLLVGSAPDTFLGAGLQTCRSVLDDGRIGEPVGATAIWASGGHESWHPHPEIFYAEGGGPMFDMGPYYVTALAALLGPAVRVSGATARTHAERTITTEARRGETIGVNPDIPTHESAIVEFANGAVATVMTSFDTPGGSTFPAPVFELYGTEGTLSLPDPNHFEGSVEVHRSGEDPETVPLTHEYTGGRGAGVADLARAARSDWSQRANVTFARHVFGILAGVRESSEGRGSVRLEPDADRPEPLPTGFPDDRRD
ncbi:MAG: Gfo/Idh/MocA family protein [Halobacteriales archaeon]